MAMKRNGSKGRAPEMCSLVDESFGDPPQPFVEIIRELDAQSGGRPHGSLAFVADCRYESALFVSVLLAHWKQTNWTRRDVPSLAEATQAALHLQGRIYVAWVPFAVAIDTVPDRLLSFEEPPNPKHIAAMFELQNELRRLADLDGPHRVVALVLHRLVRLQDFVMKGNLGVWSSGGVA
jgi:hypothetical protein